jgi:Tfp pilus assembly protein PilN
LLINVNLISERETQRRKGETAGRIAFFIAVVTFIAAMVVASLQQSRLRATRTSIAAMRVEMGKLQDQKARIDVVQRQLDNKRPLIDLLRSGRDSEAKWCAALAHISEALPERVSLTSVRSSSALRPRVKQEGSRAAAAKAQEGFTLAGQAASGNLVGQFITNLQKTDSVGDVYLQYTRKRGGGAVAETYQFEVQALLATGEASS